jgi:uncharacterized protein with PIN domain
MIERLKNKVRYNILFITMLFDDKKKCPVCDSPKVKISKPPILTRVGEYIWPFKGTSKTFNLCDDCSFSWED